MEKTWTGPERCIPKLLVLVAAGVSPAVEGGRLAARIEVMNVPTPGPPGGTPRLYGRRDAYRYQELRDARVRSAEHCSARK